MLQFYYNSNCPYAQRTWITLLELGVPFEPIEIELGKDNKTDWFLRLNPNGKVPVIKQEEKIVYESLIVNEYLAEVFGKLMPNDPFLKAKTRILMARCDANFVKYMYSYLSHNPSEDPDKEKQLQQQLITEFTFLDKTLYEKGKTYFLGDKFSLADVAYIPFMQRAIVTLSAFKNWDIFQLDLPALHNWIQSTNERKSCQETAMDEEKMKEIYARFLKLDYFKKVGIVENQ